MFSNPFAAIIFFTALLISISIHEAAHAFAADRLGDPTARLSGRLTLNPLSHLDPLGTLLLLFVGFGWGKPVPFDPFNLKNPRRDSAIISLAGPLSNIIFAIFLGLLIRIISIVNPSGQPLTFAVIAMLVRLNLVLAVFNLLPVHPLDGFKIVGGMLSEAKAREWQQLEAYGIYFLIFLLLPLGGSNVISNIITPIINLAYFLILNY